MADFLLEAKENLSADIIAIVDAEIAADVGVTSNFATSQDNCGISYDRLNRTLVFSVCTVDPASVSPTNSTGVKLWSGIHTINAGATYDGYAARNFSILTRTLDSEVVTRWDCWSNTSLVPNGIGPSDGTAKRFVEADYDTTQINKLVDPRTRNVWSHHTMSMGARSCAIYEFRFSEDYKQTISPYVPNADRHLEMFGMNDDWVLVGDLDKLTSNVYAMQLLPRVRTSDETAADYLLSYAEFDAPAATANQRLRHAVDAAGDLWLFACNTSLGAARQYVLYKLTMPTSAPFGGPVVGGGWTTVTPWAAATGANTRAAGYRGSTAQDNKIILNYDPASDTLYGINKFYPHDVYPTPTDDPADFHMDVTQVAVAGLAFTYHADVITGWVTAALAPTTDPMLAAWAVVDMWEVDGDLSYHSYTFPDVDYTRRKFFLGVVPVVAGVATGYPAGTDSVMVAATHVLMIDVDFSGTPAWVGASLYGESSWDALYTTYATAISNPNVIRASMELLPFAQAVYDIGLWDEAGSAWWWSGQNLNFWQLDAAFTPRAFPTAYIEQSPFMKISFATAPPPGSRRRGGVGIHYHTV